MYMKMLSVAAFAAACSFASASAAVIQVDPATLTGSAFVDFEDLGLANNETQNSDGTFESGTVLFGAQFAGQTKGISGDFDTLSGSPTGPLTLLNDVANENIVIVDGGDGNAGNTAIAGLGPRAYPNADAVGEGSIAMLFDFDQSEFGFDLIGGNSGSVTLQFFSRAGSLLSEIFIASVAGTLSLGFETDDGSLSIAGVVITNGDLGGIGVDNIRSDVRGVVGPPPTVSEVPLPSAALLMGFGLAGFGAMKRKKKA